MGSEEGGIGDEGCESFKTSILSIKVHGLCYTFSHLLGFHNG